MKKLIVFFATLVTCALSLAQVVEDIQINWLDTPETVSESVITVKWGIKAKTQIIDVAISLNGNVVKGINAVANDGFDMKKSQVLTLQKGDNDVEISVKTTAGNSKSSKIIKLISNENNNLNDNAFGNYPSIDSLVVAAYQEDPKAQYLMGKLYLKGTNGFEKDMFESSLWFRKSAELQYVPSMYEFSVALLDGRGIMKNQAQGINWLTQSAMKEYAEAQFRLGLCYETGEGVKKDVEKAKELYRKCPLPEAKKRLKILEKKYL